MKNRRVVSWVLVSLVAVGACAGDTSVEDVETKDAGEMGAGETDDIETIRSELTVAQRVLTFERVSSTPSQSDWILGPGSSGTISSTTTRTEGARALQIANLGFAQLQSVLIGPVGQFTPSTATFFCSRRKKV